MTKPITIPDPVITPIGTGSSSGTAPVAEIISFDHLQIVGLIKLQSNEEANTCYAGEILLIDPNVKQGEHSQLGLLSDPIAMPVLASKKEFEEIIVSSKTTVLNGLFEKHEDFVVADTGMEIRVYIEIEVFEDDDEIEQQNTEQ